MTFANQHWDDPRATIATMYKNNDYGYTMHGAKVALQVMEYLDVSPKEAKKSSLIDYGCGTGRIAAILSYGFGKTIGYDTNSNCIALANSDMNRVNYEHHNLSFTTTVPIEACDYLCSVSVLEHLDADAFRVAMINITKLTKVGAVLWYHPTKNRDMKYFNNLKELSGSNILVTYYTAEELQLGLERYLKHANR